jgi:CheY-like chemotaxis protein
VRSLHVLVVEDEHILRQAIEGHLKARGHTVYSAWTVEGAIRSLRIEHVDVLLLDVMINGDGEMGGLRIAGRTPRDIPIIVISGYNETVIRTEAARNPLTGVVRWIVKPFEMGQLGDVIEQLGDVIESFGTPPTEHI